MEEKNPFDSRTLIAIAMCLLIWFGWQHYLEKKYPPVTESAMATAAATAQKNSITPAPEGSTSTTQDLRAIKNKSAEAEAAAKADEKLWTFENDSWRVVVSSRGGKIAQVFLKNYTSKTSGDLILVSPQDQGLLNISVEGATPIDFSNVNFSLTSPSSDQLILSGVKDGVLVRKTYKFIPEKYSINVGLQINGALKDVKTVSLSSGMEVTKQEEKGFTFFSFGPSTANYQEYFFFHKNKKERDVINVKDDFNKEIDQAQLAAIGSRYFTSLFINRSSVFPNAIAHKSANAANLTIRFPVLDSQAKQIDLAFDMFIGPKSIKLLTAVEPAAAVVVDYGMFSVIAVPLLGVMKWFYGIVGNYGVAIILLTLLVRSLTFPFTYMSYKSMKSMQLLQPEVARLKEKHKGDTQTFNMEMMKLYKENKVNPMGGCLPMLLQLPVFWALYQVLQNSIELYRAPFILWIHDLSQKDPYYVLPVLMGITMFIQQKITPSTMDPAQAKMMLIMPIFFSILMFGLPSGLTLYIFVSTLFGIIQQLIIMKDRRPQAKAAILKSN